MSESVKFKIKKHIFNYLLQDPKINLKLEYSNNFAKIKKEDYGRDISNMEQANHYIKDKIMVGSPLLICRYGNAELNIINNYLYNKLINCHSYSRVNINHNLNKALPVLWPIHEETSTLDAFSKEYLRNTDLIDGLAIWKNLGENIISDFFANQMALIPIESLEPFFFKSNSWASALRNKTVLVIHPYTDSITSQHSNLNNIHPGVFPEFKLKTYRPFNAITDDISKFDSWIICLESMKEEISKIDFEIALVAAGPFGLPLSAHIKKIGKQAIHIGGALQLLFGIKGKRWENREQSKFFNEHWIYPSDNETPSEAIRMRIDAGDYWK
jgi:hypothetical protein